MDSAKPKRGLSALLASTTQQSPAPQTATAGAAQSPVLSSQVSSGDVPLISIRPNPTQPRTHFDPTALNELAASIKARGLIQPVVLRQLRPEEATADVKYELIAGERRWRASQMAGLTAVPAVIKHIFDQRDTLLLSLVENLQRDDLNPVEEAKAYKRLASTFNLTHEQIADGVGKSRATVTNVLRVLELPTSVQDAVENKKLTLAHAKVLLSIPDPRIQTQLAAKAQAEDLTVRDLERLVATDAETRSPTTIIKSRPKNTRGTKVAPPHLQDVERKLREHFGTKVSVEEAARKGRIIIEFYSVEDFERITALMGL